MFRDEHQSRPYRAYHGSRGRGHHQHQNKPYRGMSNQTKNSYAQFSGSGRWYPKSNYERNQRERSRYQEGNYDQRSNFRGGYQGRGQRRDNFRGKKSFRGDYNSGSWGHGNYTDLQQDEFSYGSSSGHHSGRGWRGQNSRNFNQYQEDYQSRRYSSDRGGRYQGRGGGFRKANIHFGKDRSESPFRPPQRRSQFPKVSDKPGDPGQVFKRLQGDREYKKWEKGDKIFPHQKDFKPTEERNHQFLEIQEQLGNRKAELEDFRRLFKRENDLRERGGEMREKDLILEKFGFGGKE